MRNENNSSVNNTDTGLVFIMMDMFVTIRARADNDARMGETMGNQRVL